MCHITITQPRRPAASCHLESSDTEATTDIAPRSSKHIAVPRTSSDPSSSTLPIDVSNSTPALSHSQSVRASADGLNHPTVHLSLLFGEAYPAEDDDSNMQSNMYTVESHLSCATRIICFTSTTSITLSAVIDMCANCLSFNAKDVFVLLDCSSMGKVHLTESATPLWVWESQVLPLLIITALCLASLHITFLRVV